jgi:dihydrofolate reductase
MHVVCWNIITPNGYIARRDGQEDFLPDVGWSEFLAETHKYNNFIVGRETYELITKLYKGMSFDDSKAAHKLLVTSRRDFSAPGFEIVHSPEEALEYLSQRGVVTAFLAGGGRLNAAFAEHGLITELVLTITPYLIGSGRPQLYPGNYEAKLELRDCTQLPNGRVRLTYAVYPKRPRL